VLEYRRANDDAWRSVSPINTIVTEFGVRKTGGRVMHYGVIRGLDWNSVYEYRVTHRRAGEVIATYQHDFRSRLPAGDPRGFSFVAYGDSADGQIPEPFRSVQRRINLDPKLDFGVLLGDNAYTFGTHTDYDNRFRPDRSPAAVAWTSGHVDYAGIGNHDMFDVSFDDKQAPRGQATRDVYSSPIPRKGITSTVDLPENEFAENNYSFDYGDVHFVTFDSNSIDFPGSGPLETEQRLDRLIDFVSADLRASTAKWKVVFAHHPFFGTEKKSVGTPFNNEFYFRKIVSSLNETKADLVLVGHSHSFSWTYPLTGFNDSNGNGQIELEEVGYVPDADRTYDKGSGLIQVVSGAAGGSIRTVDYSEPVFASAYGVPKENGGLLEFGFAKIDVTPLELKVSFISADTGQILGDTNHNGLADPGENAFGQFRIVDPAEVDPDLNADGRVDASDIDLVFAAVRDELFVERMDFNRDRKLDGTDASSLIENHLATAPGDANLDGLFDSRDLVQVFQAGEYEDNRLINSTWATGDWNGDGEFDSADLVSAFQQNVYV
jgi:hypothetical protein